MQDCLSEISGRGHAQTFLNPSNALLTEHALLFDKAHLLSSGALAVNSGEKTGRSPKDKRVVEGQASKPDVWWGDINRPLSLESFKKNKDIAQNFLSSQERVYVIDALAGWDFEQTLKIRVICSRPYHALFMKNMLITKEQVAETAPSALHFWEGFTPDFTIMNAGQCQADQAVEGVDSNVSVALSFEEKEMTILGTEYAGEMKKGVFTIMNYLLPKKGILSMHCSANVGEESDLSLFFGLSGTGKTTLSADPKRHLIGDDEHGWSDSGVFNIEGGCYAKCIDLSAEKEPEIFNAIQYGTILENVVFDQKTRQVDFHDCSLTQNTRASYPLEYMEGVLKPYRGPKPKNIIFLTCDAFGVLPPVSKLQPSQAMYHFMSGYTAKVAGTEMGVNEPQATFSACFGAAFMVWHPKVYAEILAKRMEEDNVNAWLVNTGWCGGGYGEGERISLKATRSILDAIHSGGLGKASFETDEIFGLSRPKKCEGVDEELLTPWKGWKDPEAFDIQAKKLSGLFKDNFKQFGDVGEELLSGGPR